MTWASMENYDEPAINLETKPLSQDASVIFNGIYQRHTGTVTVNPMPVGASWSLTDGDGKIHEGQGRATLISVPTGEITFKWGDLEKFTKPQPASQIRSMAKSQNISFQGVYTRQSGALEIRVNVQAAAWSVLDGDDLVTTGSGNRLLPQVPMGQMAVTWLPLANCDLPTTNPRILILNPDERTSVTRIYARHTGTVVVVATPATAP